MDADSKSPNDRLVAQLVEAILNDPDGICCETALADKVGYSVRHIRRVFAAAMGESILAYVYRIRMERAAGRLSLTDIPVKAVAQQGNYGSVPTFTRLFQSTYGVTPTEYRELNPGPSHVMPGYYDATGRKLAELPTEVGLFGRDGCLTTMMYDEARHLGRLFPDGHVEPPGGRGNGPR